jgi:hypothetical protein
LTGATTTVDGHGKYIVASSTGTAYYAFDKSSTAWTSGATYDGSTGAYTGAVDIGGDQTVSGEYVTVEFPYKTTLRHVTILPGNTTASFPGTAYIYGTNDNGTTWTSLKNWSGVTPSSTSDIQTFAVNATTTYRKYALVVNATSDGSTTAQVGEWRLFTETFTVDAGVVSTTAASGLDVGYTEHPVEAMANPIHYADGHGTYEASVSSIVQWFDPTYGSPFDKVISNNMWESRPNWSASNVYNGFYWTTDVGGTRHYGEWLQLKLPYAISLAYSEVYPRSISPNRGPGQGVILGSNDGEHWYKITEFSGKTYTNGVATIIDVNATTPYQYFRMTVNKLAKATNSDTRLNVGEWKLFAEKPVTRMENVHISGDLSSETLQTGYIKWPRKSLKANESEGYVASASSVYNSDVSTAPYTAFNNYREVKSNGYADAFVGGNGDFTAGVANKSRTTGTDTFNHEWLQIQLPRAITLSYFTLLQRVKNVDNPDETPKNGRMYGSNDGVSWTKLVTFSNLTYERYEETRVEVKSTTPYSYYRLAVTEVVGSRPFVAVGELQLFEAATGVGATPTSAKLQVAGSLGMAKGSEFFAGDDVVMELPKHDRPLVKYPEVKMTTDADTISGYRGYKVSTSNDGGANDTNLNMWRAFNGLTGNEGWVTSGSLYDSANDYLYSGSNTLGGVSGEWLKLELPTRVQLAKIVMTARNISNEEYPEDFQILGSNDDHDWVQVMDVVGAPFTQGATLTFNAVSNVVHFKYLAVVVTRTKASSGVSTLPNSSTTATKKATRPSTWSTGASRTSPGNSTSRCTGTPTTAIRTASPTLRMSMTSPARG